MNDKKDKEQNLKDRNIRNDFASSEDSQIIQKQIEDALNESEKRFRALFDACFEAIFISVKGVCIDANRLASEMFGYTYDELIGIFGTDVIATEYKEIVKNKMLSDLTRK